MENSKNEITREEFDNIKKAIKLVGEKMVEVDNRFQETVKVIKKWMDEVEKELEKVRVNRIEKLLEKGELINKEGQKALSRLRAERRKKEQQK
jgi:DNA anti-recombination protein RmuC